MSCFCCNFVYLGIGVVAIYYLLKRYARGGQYTKNTTIDNKVVIITGANAGIGKANAIDLAKRGGKIYIACRDKTRGENALNDIRKQSGSDKVYFLPLDLASLKSIREFSNKFHQLENKLDILINNAGLLCHNRSLTEDGFEMHMGVNHLGHFLLTNLLLDLLKAAAPSRIVVVSSRANEMHRFDKDDIMTEKNYSAFKAYAMSKIANILFSKELAERLKGTKVTVNSCHPGVVQTEIVKGWSFSLMDIISYIFMKFGKTPMEGAQTQIRLAVDPELETVTGKYFSDCNVSKTSPDADDSEIAKWLWMKSSELVKLNKE
ncbi:retinol dehydrogenase 12-like [Chironomus tepperi]|uniref:retinol dehydrogenase 12-like n=1 Tax=Chironomus tepperi TaxID=113505 RepID=UPI00391FC62B